MVHSITYAMLTIGTKNFISIILDPKEIVYSMIDVRVVVMRAGNISALQLRLGKVFI